MLKERVPKINIGVSLDEDLVKYLDKQAKKHRVKRSNYINHLIEEDRLSQVKSDDR